MHLREQAFQVYQELADSFEQQQNPGMRDLFLMLAADTALRAGRDAETLRHRLLRLNPDHFLKPYLSFAEAITAPDIHDYLDELRQKYPIEVAKDMLGAAPLQTSLEVSNKVSATVPPAARPPISPPAGNAAAWSQEATAEGVAVESSDPEREAHGEERAIVLRARQGGQAPYAGPSSSHPPGTRAGGCLAVTC